MKNVINQRFGGQQKHVTHPTLILMGPATKTGYPPFHARGEAERNKAREIHKSLNL